MNASSLARAAARTARRYLRFHPWRAAYRAELGDAHVEGRVWLPGTGMIRIGHGVRLVARRSTIELHAHAGGAIIIEDGAVIGEGTSIEATSLVRIGARAHVGPFCKIIDNHFHQTTGDRSQRPDAVPVIVGPGARIGARAVLLPGAEIGAGASVGPACVVSFRLPSQREFPGTASASTSAT
jgi:acetyltransferase-like isoleucine patch superfamily enzyme